MHMSRKLVTAVAIAVPVATNAALYEEVTHTQLPPNLAGACMNAAAGDVDGDGDPDLALAMEFEPKILLLNDGRGRFTDASTQLPRTVHDSEDVAFADFDGDGDLDLVFVSEDDRTDELFINDGTGRFTDASERLVTDDVTNGLVLMDLDGDGRLDVLTANIGLERALISDGDGGFRDETDTRWPQQGESRSQALETGDVDGDGDLDVIVSNEGQNQLYLNEGGRLVDMTATHMPLIDDETRDIRAVDIDGDGDLDLIVGNVTFVMQASAQDYVLLNDGAGHFTRADASVFPEDARSNFTLKAMDLDRDGDIDVLAPSTVFSDNTAEYLVIARDSDGAQLMLQPATLYFDDVDGDGDADTVIGDGTRTIALLFDGTNLVYPAGEAAWSSTVRSQALDLDNNGQPDLALTRAASGLLGQGASGRGEVQLVDLGQDGSIDAVVPVLFGLPDVGNYLVLLNEDGRFAVAAPGSVIPEGATGNGFDAEVADFDGDGRQDLFFCNRTSLRSSDDQQAAGGLQRLLRGIADPEGH